MVGRRSRMRVSSATPPAGVRGTLKSARIKTRRPEMSSSEIVLMAMMNGGSASDAGGKDLWTKKNAPWLGRAENARRKIEKLEKFPQGNRAYAPGNSLQKNAQARSPSSLISEVTKLISSVARATIIFGSYPF